MVYPVNDPPTFQLSTSFITIDEGVYVDQPYQYPAFLHDILPGPANAYDELVSQNWTLRFEVSQAEAVTASFVISGKSAELQLTMQPYFNGLVLFKLCIVDDMMYQNTTCIDFNVTVVPVNNCPLFDLVLPLLDLTETSAPADLELAMAVNISAGVPGHEGMPYNEASQLLSFIIVPADPNQDLFSRAECVACSLSLVCSSRQYNKTIWMSADGTLHLHQTPYRNGKATYNVTLVDDGGTLHGGCNTSRVHPLEIRYADASNPLLVPCSSLSRSKQVSEPITLLTDCVSGYSP